MILDITSKMSSTVSIILLITLVILIIALIAITKIEEYTRNLDGEDENRSLIIDDNEDDYIDDKVEYKISKKVNNNEFTISLNNNIYDENKPLKSETVLYVLLKLLGNNKEIYYTDTNELADKLNMPASTIRASLKRLEDKEIIVREKEIIDGKTVKKIIL